MLPEMVCIQANVRRGLNEKNIMKLIFNLGDKVKINELETTGRVLSIWICETGIKYEVRYFYNGDAKIYFFTKMNCN